MQEPEKPLREVSLKGACPVNMNEFSLLSNKKNNQPTK